MQPKNMSPRQRTRERLSMVTVLGRIHQVRYDKNGTNTVVYDKQRVAMIRASEVMRDVVTPGYHALMAKGVLVNNPLSKTSYAYSGDSAGAEFRLPGDGVVTNYTRWEEQGSLAIHYFGVPTPLPSTVNEDNLIALTQTACLSSVGTSSFQGFVALAEAKKTLDMITHPLKSVSELLAYVSQLRAARQNIKVDWNDRTSRTINGRRFDLKPRRYKGPGKLLGPPKGGCIIPIGKAISGAVLANNLGLRPLMMDLDALLKDIPKAHMLPYKTFRAMRTTESSRSSDPSLTNSVVTGNFHLTSVHKHKVRCAVVVQDKFDILSDFGMSLYDLPSSAWELVPYSFLVDYFVNIGDYLAAFRATQTRNIVLFSTSVSKDSETTRTWKSISIAAPWMVTRQPAGSEVVIESVKTRSPATFSGALAYAPSESILTPSHVQNGISLTLQAFANLK